MATNKEKLNAFLGKEALESKEIQKVVLLGSFLKNSTLRSYLQEDLGLNGEIISMDGGSEYDEFATIIEGLNIRTLEVIEAEEIRQQEGRTQEIRRGKASQNRGRIKGQRQS